jgi:tetratricopeptide (TPR) repeat protein
MTVQGDISSLALADIVQNIAANQKTGTLTIQNEAAARHIQFQDGKIVSYADNLGFSPARWLEEKEIVPPEEMEGALRRYRKAKRKSFGEILRDLKLMSAEEYAEYVSDLVVETLYEVLSFRDGSFEFHEGALDEGLSEREVRALGLEFSAQGIVMEAARRMDDWENIRRHIPSESEIYHVPPPERKKCVEEGVEDVVREAADLLDGTRTVREVIARLPYSRFDACRAIAQLIGAKRARLLDSAGILRHGVLRQGRRQAAPEQEIACLRAILEREPGNRDVLDRLAVLHEELGEIAEGVKCLKLLAISFLDEGDLPQAEKHLRKAIQGNPGDLATWEKLWDVVRRAGNRETVLSLGNQFAAHFRKMGLTEVARDHLIEMVKLFPDDPRLKLDLADSRFALGEVKACVHGLFELARSFLSKHRIDEAEKVFARILKYDRENPKAREYYAKIRSGKLARRRALRRRILHGAAVVAFIASLLAFFAYDIVARAQLASAAQNIIEESLLESGRYAEAASRIEAVRARHPWSVSARLEARALLGALKGRAAGAGPAGPAAPAAGSGTGTGGG